MKFNQFVSEIYKTVKEKLGDGYHVEIQKVPKNNGSVRTGLCIRYREEHVVPIIYLEPFYKNFVENLLTWDKIIGDIMNVLQDCVKPEIEPADIREFDKVKDKVACKLISAERNQELLEDIPYIRWMQTA